MYLNHFGLREMPFGLTPDTAFAYSTRAHQEALNTLIVAANTGEGFIKITGEIGTGKTLLCRRFLRSLPPDFVTCYLPNPIFTPRTLVLSIADELGESLPTHSDPYHLHRVIGQRLVRLASEGKRVIVCLDEAQALSAGSLEVLRLMSNLETEKKKLMQVVLFGQPELDERLGNHDLRQLRQRITFAYKMREMTCPEVRHYVRHRMGVAGSRGLIPQFQENGQGTLRPDSIFTPDAIQRLHKASRGTPRVVNILAHKALLAAFGEGEYMVDDVHVRAAVDDSADNVASSQPRRRLSWIWR